MWNQNNVLVNKILMNRCVFMQIDKSVKVMISLALSVTDSNVDTFTVR